MIACWKTAPRVALVIAALLAGGEATASPFYRVTDLGTGWSNAPASDGEGRWVLSNDNTGATVPFAPSSSNSFEVDAELLPKMGGWHGTGTSVPKQWEMRVTGSNALGTVIGGYPDGGSLANPYSSMKFGYVTRDEDGGYGDFVGLSSGNGQYLLLNALNQVVFDRWKLHDIATGTTKNLVDLISPEALEELGPLAANPDSYWGFALADDGSILAKLQDPSGERALLLSPPTPTHAPEPSTLALLVAAGLGMVYRRMRR